MRRVVAVGVARGLTPEVVHEERRLELNRERLRAGGRRRPLRARDAVVDRDAQPAVRGRRVGRLKDDEVRAGRDALLVPVRGERRRDHRLRVDDRQRRGDFRVEARRLGAHARALPGGERRALPLVPLIPQRHVRRDIGWTDRLVEAKGDDGRPIETAVQAIPARLEQPHGRRREREGERTSERSPTDGLRVRGDRHVVARRVRQRFLRIGGEHEQGRARPSKRSAHGRPNREERRRHLVGHPSERHHRLGEAHADFRGLFERRELAGRLTGDHGERGLRARGRGDREQGQGQESESNAHGGSQETWGSSKPRTGRAARQVLAVQVFGPAMYS